MKINYEKLEDAINGDANALFHAFLWSGTPQGHYYWEDQYFGRRPLDIATLKSMRKTPSIKVGETYTSWNGDGWECIFVDGGKAWLRSNDASTAYVWDASTGKSISLGEKYNIDLTPKPVVETRTGTVTFTDGVADFDTWKEL